MSNNDILRRLRYIFNYNDSLMIELFGKGGEEITHAYLSNWLRREEDEQYLPMHDHNLATFLNGLIVHLRGTKNGDIPIPETYLSNNMILRKLKIALALKDTDMLEIFLLAGRKISKHELSAFFRHPDQAQYRLCNDQFLRNFLKGVQIWYKPGKTAEAPF